MNGDMKIGIMRFNLLLFYLSPLFLFSATDDSHDDSGDAIDDDNDPHLIHIGNVGRDSCTVDKQMNVSFAGVPVICGDTYFLAGFDNAPKIILNRANIVSSIKGSWIFYYLIF